MFGSKFNQAKCETSSRLCVQRIKLIRNKKTLALKQSQKDIADLLRGGKQEYARIRVEGVIREKLLMQAYEILELYLELLTVRTQLIAKTKELPRDMMEAVSSIIYAAQRISDLPELSTLRALFASKYGREYAAEAAADATASRWQVNANLIRCLLVEAPQPEEKLAMLSEIAQEHCVEWDLSAAARDLGVGAGALPGVLPLRNGPTGEPAAAAAAAAGPSSSSAAPPYPRITPPPVLGDGHYVSAQQAAVAAAAAAAQANAAAQYAAQLAAMAPHNGGGGGGGGQFVGLGIPSAAQAWQPPPPSNGDLSSSGAAAAVTVGLSMPPLPSPPDEARGGALPSPPPLPPLPPPASSGGGASSVGSAGGYLVRSNSDIQRAYDAAEGPPTKGASAACSAPVPAPPAAPVQAPAPPPPPSPPPEKLQPSAPPPPPSAMDEYEELARRLEALKKS